MCGIAGVIQARAGQELAAVARQMAGALLHRGPDDEGVWVSGELSVALAHRRLAIQDLSPNGHQPMHSRSGRFVIVFNGEIYNFRSLASELAEQGYVFRGGSDTEVILAGVELWGLSKTLTRLVGMFAFALLDLEARELILARDRLGEKPLYYGWAEGGFWFASELKAICGALPGRPAFNSAAVTSFLRFGYIPNPHTIYSGFFKLPAGSLISLPLSGAAGSVSKECLPQRYWSLEKVVCNSAKVRFDNEDAAIAELDGLLSNAISDQLVADVPLGSFLSGGIDSTLVTAVAQSVSRSPIDTFTIGFKEKLFDEAPFARRIAQHLGANHHELYVSADDCLGLVSEIPKYWDEPFADSSQLPAMLVARSARRHVTVCLTGDGGDELFCGYNRYILGYRVLSKARNLPAPLRRALSRALLRIPVRVWDGLYEAFAALSHGATQANFGGKIIKAASLLGSRGEVDAYKYLLSMCDDPVSMTGVSEAPSVLDLIPPDEAGSFIRRAMYWDQLGYLADDNLVKGDRSSMAWSLEARLPLLDHRVVEYSWRLPDSMLVRDGKSKWILRQLLYKYVPKELVERPKMGFSVPLAAWLRHELRPWAERLLGCLGEVLPEQAAPKVNVLWQEHLAGRRDNSQLLWAVLMLISWHRHYQGEPQKC